MANYVCIDGCGQRVSAKNKRCRKCAGLLRRKIKPASGGTTFGCPTPAERVRPAAPSEATGEPIPAGDWVAVPGDFGADLTLAGAGQLLSAAAALRAALVE